MNRTKHILKLKATSLSLALIAALGVTSVNATYYDITGTFVMLDPAGNGVGVFPDLIGSYEDSSALGADGGITSMDFSSPTPFFSAIWDARDQQVFVDNNTVSIEACLPDGSVSCTAPAPMTMTVDDGQWGAHMLFDWSFAASIDVVNVWDVTYDETGVIKLISTDDDGNGVRGVGMVDGAFVGFNANFDLTLEPPFLAAVAATQGGNSTSTADPTNGNVTVDAGYTGTATYDWSVNTSAAVIAAAVGGTTNQTLVFDPSGLAPGASLLISASITEGADTIRAEITMSVPTVTLNGALDADSDGTDDASEGFSDSSGNGIPDFMSNDVVYSNATEVQYDTLDNTGSSRILKTSAGTLSIGSGAEANGNSIVSTAGNSYTVNDLAGAYSPSMTATQIGVVDDKVITGCVGGCVDFIVSGLAVDDIIDVVIPQTAAIPAHPVYKKLAGGNWRGFDVSQNDYQSSAAATGTGYAQCPPPGDAAYTKGLTVGHTCVQLTLQDGGPNDLDGTANGQIVDPGGVGQLDLKQASVRDIGAVFGLLMGLPLLIVLRLFRNK